MAGTLSHVSNTEIGQHNTMSQTTGAAAHKDNDTPANAASTGDGNWEMVVTSPFLKKAAWVGVVIVMLVHIFMAIVVGIGDTGVTIQLTDKLGFVGIGLLFSFVCLLFLRPRVRVNAQGVEVRNMVNAQFYPWEIIHGLSFPSQARTARLELPDFEFVPMLAMHIRDRDTIAQTVEEFRRLEDRYMPED